MREPRHTCDVLAAALNYLERGWTPIALSGPLGDGSCSCALREGLRQRRQAHAAGPDLGAVDSDDPGGGAVRLASRTAKPRAVTV